MTGIAATMAPMKGMAPAKANATAASVKQPRMTKSIRESAYQNGLKRTERRFWCDACRLNFITIETDPKRCPSGHSALAVKQKSGRA
jgi:hypothetical protein